jgi:hypothetical protein
MVAVASSSTRISASQERAIYDELYNRGALTPAQVATLVGTELESTERWLADKAFRHVIDFDPRFGRYGID